jgi:exopolysaccharide production protein ExoQ
VAIAGLDPDPILEMMGKDPTLTGRTEIWPYVIDAISQRPMLGWGFSGFWSPDNPAAVEINDATRLNLPDAQNGLLQMLVDVGIVGTSIFFVLWARNAMFALRCIYTPANELAVSSLICFGLIILYGVSEPVLQPLQISTCMFFVFGFMCERATRVAHPGRYSQGNLPARSPNKARSSAIP